MCTSPPRTNWPPPICAGSTTPGGASCAPPRWPCGDEPREQLVGLFDAVDASFRRHGFHGCPFINAAAESEPGSLPNEVTAEHKRTVRAWVRDLAEAAGAG